MKNFSCRMATIVVITMLISCLAGCSKYAHSEIVEETVVSSMATIEPSETTTIVIEESTTAETSEIEVTEIEPSEETTIIETSAAPIETQVTVVTPNPTVVEEETISTSVQAISYVCDMCNQSFNKQSDLNNHLEVVHGYGDEETAPAITVAPSPTPTSAPTPTPLPARLYAMANVTYTVDSWTEERGEWHDEVTYNVEVVQNNGNNYIGQWMVCDEGTVANNIASGFPHCTGYSDGYNITLTTEPYTK